jgi:hypothetical protein
MQAYEVEFVPAQRPPLRIKDAIRADTVPHPHVAVGDPDTPGRGVRIPLTSRLVASCNSGPPLICRAAAYRDPKTGRIVLGVEPPTDAGDARALVLLAASSRFPDGFSITPQQGVSVLATGDLRHGQHMLALWTDGGTILVEDPAREERYEVRRTGDQFNQTALSSAP